MMMLPVQVQILTIMLTLRDGVAGAAQKVRDDERGELTGNVIFLAALAVAAAIVAALVIDRINSNAERIPT